MNIQLRIVSNDVPTIAAELRILPQSANMNRGAWLLTEEIVECYRDIGELLVIGGVVWGDSRDGYQSDSSQKFVQNLRRQKV